MEKRPFVSLRYHSKEDKGEMARRTRWLCSSVKAEYDLVHGEKECKGETGKQWVL